MPKAVILRLIDAVSDDLCHPTSRSHAVPVQIQVLVALRFYAKGCFLSETADIHGVSKATAAVCLTTVTSAICRNVKLIHFPSSTEQLTKTKVGFLEIAGFPNVIGIVDGTQIPIVAPSEDEPSFVCRKGYHSLNVQGIIDAKLRFTNIVSQWPGSVHDAFIWSNCEIAAQLERQDVEGWLLGDSGYALSPWLLTPKADPITPAEKAYNKSFKTTRCSVERAFGVLKSRFRCLHKSGGCLHFKPQKCCRIIVAVCQLHTLCIDNNVPEPDVSGDSSEEDEDSTTYNGPVNDGKTVQDRLIATRFY